MGEGTSEVQSLDAEMTVADFATRIEANLAALEERIGAACRRAHRQRDSVRLLPVSKTFGVAAVEAAYRVGARQLAENKVQELQAKAEACEHLELEWVLIGHLQTNKAKLAARYADEFQALDSVRVAHELDRRRRDALDTGASSGMSSPLRVLVQVNSSGEATKSGVAPEAVPNLAEELAAFPGLAVCGLMTLAANTSDSAEVGRNFAAMAALREQLIRSGVPGSWDELSMGMSGDFELAIEHGATCIRIGTAIFGDRKG